MSEQFFVFGTDVLSEYARLNATAVACVHAAPALLRRTTVVSEMELLEGRFQSFRSADTPDRLCEAQRRLDTTRELLAAFPSVLTVDAQVAELLFRWLSLRGLRKIGRRDLLIAAIAVRHNAVLVTGNIRHFAKIPGLHPEDWRVLGRR